ncbi:MAG: fused MFS/spermidine synthase [Planctomycetota bacterium]|jgi:spermidine synthase
MTTRARVLLLYATLLVSGASVMVLEILGTRLLGPLYGVGVQVWAALITVTLLALAVGYWVGGALADRWPSGALFHLLVVLAAAATFLVEGLAGPITESFAGMGLEAGALTSALALFGPGLFLLGTLTPFACRIHPAHAERTGRTVGRLYAVSTLGSVLGALLSGFVLLPWMPVSRIFLATGAALAVIGVIGLVSSRRGTGIVAGAILLVFAMIPLKRTIAVRTEVSVVRDEQTFFNRIQTLDGFGERYLFLDGVVHTHILLDHPDPIRCEYIRMAEIVPAIRPMAKRFLLIGCGGGAMLRLLEGHGRTFEVLDIDPRVIETARRDFAAGVEGATFLVEDGRRYLRRGGTWDAVLLDVVSTENMPEHLSSVEFLREVRNHLEPDGVLFMNSIGEPGGRVLASMRRTLAEAFGQVVGFTAHAEEYSTNVLWVASAQPFDVPAPYRPRIYEAGGEGVVLTDDYNPINLWNAGMGLELRRDLQKRFGRAVFRPR